MQRNQKETQNDTDNANSNWVSCSYVQTVIFETINRFHTEVNKSSFSFVADFVSWDNLQ